MKKEMVLLVILLVPSVFAQPQMAPSIPAMGVGILIVVGFLVLISIASFVLFILAFIDILKSDKESGWKVKWILICFFLSLVGVALYHFLGKKKTAKKMKKVQTPEVNPKLTKYINDQIANGYSKAQITTVLRESGYDSNTIELGFSSLK